MEKNQLSEGKVVSVLISFSAPFLVANILQALYGAVDLMIIGRYCTSSSVAAVSVGTQVTQIITSLITGLTMGGTILVGKYVGMRKEEEVKHTIGTTLTVFAVVSVILTVLMFGLTEPVLRVLKTPQDSFHAAKVYVRICASGIFFICGYNVLSAILRGYGDSKRPMIFIGIACILNLIGDVVFVKFLNLDVAGTALATIISQAISMMIAIWYLNRNNFLFQFRVVNFRIHKGRLKELAVLGMPISLQECMVRFSFLYLTAVINQLGVSAVAAVGIASKYDVFAMLPATSVSSALAAITAQNYGAGKPDRVKISCIYGIEFALSISMVFFLWAQLSPASMLGIFAKDTQIISAGKSFFRTCSYDYLMVPFVFCLNGFLNGSGRTLFTMCSVCFGALCLRIPLIYGINQFFPDNLAFIGLAAPIISGIMAVYTLYYALRKIHDDCDSTRGKSK